MIVSSNISEQFGSRSDTSISFDSPEYTPYPVVGGCDIPVGDNYGW